MATSISVKAWRPNFLNLHRITPRSVVPSTFSPPLRSITTRVPNFVLSSNSTFKNTHVERQQASEVQYPRRERSEGQRIDSDFQNSLQQKEETIRKYPARGMSLTGAARQSFWFQFVTTPTADTSGTTLILHFNSQRYVFGRVAEGTQRAFIERSIGLRKVQNVFLTGDSAWSLHGGLLGMLLTTADVHANAQLSSDNPIERARFNIHGPPGTAHMLASARRFIFRTGMPLSVHEYGVMNSQSPTSDPTWADDNVRVWAVPAELRGRTENDDNSSEENLSDSMSEIRATSSGTPSAELEKEQITRHSIIQDMFDSDWRHDRLIEAEFQDVRLPAKIHIRNPSTNKLEHFQCAAMSDAPHISPDTKVLVKQPWPGSRWEALPDRKNLPHKAVSYIVKGHMQRGVFEKSKAMALGLKPGPTYSKLVAGKSVQMEDGRTITPEMVLGPSKPGQGIAVIDLPHKSFVSGLLSRPEWTDAEIMGGIKIFCWIASDNVLEHPEVQEFIQLNSHVRHIFASANTCPNYLAMDSSAASTLRLSCLSRDHFSIPIHDNLTGITSGAPNSIKKLLSGLDLSGRPAERGLTLQIEPKYQMLEQHVVPPLNTYKVIEEIPTEALNLARSVVQKTKDATSDKPGDNDPEIITLGTGSAVPSKYRNVSATLLKMPGYGYYLFDCGENTLGQLKRMYNAEDLQEVLSNMRMIWISHLHADHHLGTLSLLQAIRQANKSDKTRKPFALVADEAMIDFVRDMAGKGRNNFTAGSMHHLVCQGGQPLQQKDKRGQLHELTDDYLSDTLHIRVLRTTWVSHCAGAQAISVEFTNGFKISYSGDCRPSKNFARIGADSDVLIHEATFEDDLEGDAIAKKHSTTSEALGVAAQMRAKNVILTHFSQRYQKIPVMTHIKRPEEIFFEEGSAETGFSEEPIQDDGGPVDHDLPRREEGSLRYSEATPRNRTTAASSTNILDQMNVCIAFDFMRMRVSQIKDIHKLYPAIEALFESQQKFDVQTTATAEEKSAAINRGKLKGGGGGKKEANGNGGSNSAGTIGEKRKSDSSGGEEQRKATTMSKKAQRRLQLQREEQDMLRAQQQQQQQKQPTVGHEGAAKEESTTAALTESPEVRKIDGQSAGGGGGGSQQFDLGPMLDLKSPLEQQHQRHQEARRGP